ncbi:uncharacterized protein BDZ99DRAFT_349075, partial [Mytilinidion resinicola]
PQPLIWINAFPGTGKLTISKLLIPLRSPTKAILIDNHQLIDPVSILYARDHPSYQTERKHLRDLAFTSHVEDPSTFHRIAIFTATPLAAGRAGRVFVPVYLTRDVAESVPRMTSAERIGG